MDRSLISIFSEPTELLVDSDEDSEESPNNDSDSPDGSDEGSTQCLNYVPYICVWYHMFHCVGPP
jgi:hypothetical protein